MKVGIHTDEVFIFNFNLNIFQSFVFVLIVVKMLSNLIFIKSLKFVAFYQTKSRLIKMRMNNG